MAEIQENPYGTVNARPASSSATPGAAGPGLIVQKAGHLPHLPSELRHTNYSSSKPPPQLVNNAVAQARDSANFSMASNESG